MKTFEIIDEGIAIRCLFCGRVSHNINYVKKRYCANCRIFHLQVEHVDLGTCCACGGESGLIARNILALKKRTPVPGTGWGCFQCNLPMNGAYTVLCDDCLPDEPGQKPRKEIKFVVDGIATDKKRIPIEDLAPDPFDHDYSKHYELGRLN